MVTTHSYPYPNTNLSLFLCVHEIWFLIRPPPTFLDNVTEFPVFLLKASLIKITAFRSARTSVVPHKHDSTWTWLLLVYFFSVNKLRLHVELIPISEHQHDFKFSWSWSKVIYLLSTYKMVGIFLMFRKLSINSTKDWQRKLLYSLQMY